METRPTVPEALPNQPNRGSNRRLRTGFLEDSTFKNNPYKHRLIHNIAVIPSGGIVEYLGGRGGGDDEALSVPCVVTTHKDAWFITIHSAFDKHVTGYPKITTENKATVDNIFWGREEGHST